MFSKKPTNPKKDVYIVPDDRDEIEETDNEDDRLQRAIALSNQQSSPLASTSTVSIPEVVMETTMTRPRVRKPVAKVTPTPASPVKRKRIEEKIEINLCSDDDEVPAKKKARDLGGLGVGLVWKQQQEEKARERAKDKEKEKKAPSGLAALGLDRKQLEQERLARVKKQQKQIDTDGSRTAIGTIHKRSEVKVIVDKVVVEIPKKPKSTEQKNEQEVPARNFYEGKVRTLRDTPPVADRRVLRSSPTNTVASANTGNTSSNSRKSTPTLATDDNNYLQYPTGIVKKTWAEGQQRTGDEVTIEEVLQKDTLTITVLSAFQWDYQWIMSKLPLRKRDLQLVLVMQGKGPAEKHEKEAIFFGLPKVQLVFPNMEGQINCMHSKLMLLFHKSGEREWLRVAVPSANLTDYDWGHMGGIMENSVFIIDLPRLTNAEMKPDQTLFMESLQYFCAECNIPDETLGELIKYDFSKTERMAFVHSIGGSHGGNSWKRTGFCGLGEAVKKLGLSSGQGLEIDYVTSSLGAVKEQFIMDMYHAAQGQNGLRALERRNARPNTKKALAAKAKKKPEEESTDDESELEEETDWEAVKKRFRVYFPSRDTVITSVGGAESAGTVCFQQKWWNDKTFPRSVVCDCKSTRKDMLMHNKILFARPPRELESESGEKVGAWAYVGSANFSESAWGKLVIDRQTKKPKINCKNWECGVVIPVPMKPQTSHMLSGKPPPGRFPLSMPDAFDGVVPVPMQTPGEPLIGERKDPWYVQELQRLMMGGMG